MFSSAVPSIIAMESVLRSRNPEIILIWNAPTY